MNPAVNDSTSMPNLAYQLLKAALEKFQKTPSELDRGQLEAISRLAERQHQLEARVLASAEARDVVVPDTVVNSAMTKIEERYGTHDEFLEDLARNSMSLESLRAALQRELAVESVLERVGARAATVSDLDISIYYHLHRDRFHIPATRTARHILITINPQFPENSRASAFERASDIAARLKKKPKRFAEMAQLHSECPTALKGGLLGRVPKGQLFPELDTVLFKMAAGEISDVVESSLGFHVMLCEQVHNGGSVSLADARPRIREILVKRGQRMCQRNWIASLSKTEQSSNKGSCNE